MEENKMAIKSYTEKQIKQLKDRTDWEYLRNMKDEDIDDSDMPELTDKMLANGTFYSNGKPVNKTEVNLKLDSEVLNYFKKMGSDWEYRINEVLSQVVKTNSVFN